MFFNACYNIHKNKVLDVIESEIFLIMHNYVFNGNPKQESYDCEVCSPNKLAEVSPEASPSHPDFPVSEEKLADCIETLSSMRDCFKKYKTGQRSLALSEMRGY